MIKQLSVMLYGGGGTGKSFIAATAPKKLLYIDTEGRSDLLPEEYTQEHWDRKGSVPDSDIVIVRATDEKSMEAALAIPRSHSEGTFRSIVLDSFTAWQSNVILQHYPNGKKQQKDYDYVLSFSLGVVIDLMNLRTDGFIDCAVVTAWEAAYDGKVGPQMVGAVKKSFEHGFDIMGQVEMRISNDRIAQLLHVMPLDGRCAKDSTILRKIIGTEKLIKGFPNPNLTNIMEQ